MIEEEKARRTNILTTILRCSILFLGLLEVVITLDYAIHRSHYHGLSVLSFTSLWLTFIVLYILTKLGRVELVSHFLVWLLFCSACYGAYTWGADLQGVLLGFVITISASTILLGNRYGFLMTAFVIGAMGIFWYLQVSGLIFPDRSWRTDPSQYEDIVSYMFLVLLLMSLSWLSNSEMLRSLKRTRGLEDDLRQERDQLEIKVSERTRQLKEVQAEKLSQMHRFSEFGRIATGVFHDLLNPLSAVMLNLTEAKKDKGLTPNIKEYVDRADKIGSQMSSFMQTIRKQVRMTETEEELSPYQEIEDSLKILHFKILKARAEIDIDCHPQATLFGNPLKFHQIVTNLVNNALDAYADSESDDRRIVIYFESGPQAHRLIISDNGPGIDKEIMPHIFDPFFSTKSSEKNMGMGLSMIKEIVENDFEGTIAVESSEEGTCFKIYLPKRYPSAFPAQAD